MFLDYQRKEEIDNEVKDTQATGCRCSTGIAVRIHHIRNYLLLKEDVHHEKDIRLALCIVVHRGHTGRLRAVTIRTTGRFRQERCHVHRRQLHHL